MTLVGEDNFLSSEGGEGGEDIFLAESVKDEGISAEVNLVRTEVFSSLNWVSVAGASI